MIGGLVEGRKKIDIYSKIKSDTNYLKLVANIKSLLVTTKLYIAILFSNPKKRRKQMNSEKKTATTLEDPKVNIKTKLSILWITLMWFYAYNDIISFFRKDTHEGALSGQFEGVVISQEFLLGASILMSIPIFMVFLSIALPAKINRPLNIIMGIFHAIVLAGTISVPGETWAHYTLYMIFEAVFIVLIIWYAWNWPTQEGIPT